MPTSPVFSRSGSSAASATPNTAPYTTPYNFQYPLGNPAPSAQYTFNKLLQCNPRGEFRVNGNSYDVRRVVEIGLVQTHGSTIPTPTSGAGTSTATYSGNVAALDGNGGEGERWATVGAPPENGGASCHEEEGNGDYARTEQALHGRNDTESEPDVSG